MTLGIFFLDRLGPYRGMSLTSSDLSKAVRLPSVAGDERH